MADESIPPPLRGPAGYTPRPATSVATEPPPAKGPYCQNCGAGPAAHATFYQAIGMLLRRSVRTIDGTFCRSCGLALGRTVANRNLWTGWWGIISFFFTIGYMLSNAGTLLRHGSVGPPKGGHGTLDPGRPMLFRSGIVMLAAIVALGIAVAANSGHKTNTSNDYGAPSSPTPDYADTVATDPVVVTDPPTTFAPNPTWEMGACISVTGAIAEPVSCDESHQGTVVAVTTDEAACPPATDGTVNRFGSVYCVDTG